MQILNLLKILGCYNIPIYRDLMASIKVFGKPCSGAKNSRMGTFQEILGKVFENLGVEFYFTKMFSRKWFYMDGVEKEKRRRRFYKSGIVYKCSPNQLTRATTLAQYGTGLSLKFIRLSAGSLALYKGL
jgi:hypothetical protein